MRSAQLLLVVTIIGVSTTVQPFLAPLLSVPPVVRSLFPCAQRVLLAITKVWAARATFLATLRWIAQVSTAVPSIIVFVAVTTAMVAVVVAAITVEGV